MELVCLVGLKRSGKNTVANHLVSEYGYIEYAFADPIKKACKEIFLFTDEQLDGSLKESYDERWGLTPRQAYQVIGTELFQFDIHNHIKSDVFDNIGRTLWVHRFELWLKTQPINSKIVVTDGRFIHEVDCIRKQGGEIWKIERPSLISTDNHQSETELQTIISDLTIINDGDVNKLHKNIDLYLFK